MLKVSRNFWLQTSQISDTVVVGLFGVFPIFTLKVLIDVSAGLRMPSSGYSWEGLFFAKLGLSGLVSTISLISLITYQNYFTVTLSHVRSSEFIMISLISKDGLLIVLPVIFKNAASFSFLFVHPSFDIMDVSFHLIEWSSSQACLY